MNAPAQTTDWPNRLFDTLKRAGIAQVGYVPDAGHARLIDLCRADAQIRDIVLTTEEEGVALAAGAWLGGQRCALLMQSSGVGNCINMLSLMRACRFPVLMLITMRGEWEEFNPWQVPMGQAARTTLETMGTIVYVADSIEEIAPMVNTALRLAYESNSSTAVLISQHVIGIKNFEEQANQ